MKDLTGDYIVYAIMFVIVMIKPTWGLGTTGFLVGYSHSRIRHLEAKK